jgi:hypothetical protein
MPLLIAGLPTEYKTKNSTGQSTQNQMSSHSQVTVPSCVLGNQGYVVLDDAAFPIIGGRNY